jgi:hypothetical protein
MVIVIPYETQVMTRVSYSLHDKDDDRCGATELPAYLTKVMKCDEFLNSSLAISDDDECEFQNSSHLVKVMMGLEFLNSSFLVKVMMMWSS